LELAGDRHELEGALGQVTAEKQIADHELARVAFRHSGERR
jgi:hypothetical protein